MKQVPILDLSPHKLNKVKKFTKVPTKGVTAENVLILWQRGQLYIAEKETGMSKGDLLAHCQRDALAYVKAIDEYATNEWRPYIRKIWEKVVCDDLFREGLVMKQKRELNRYFVTGIVYNLQVKGIYQPVERVSQLRLHLTLEHIKVKNSIFKNWGYYAINPMQRKRLQVLMDDFLTSLN